MSEVLEEIRQAVFKLEVSNDPAGYTFYVNPDEIEAFREKLRDRLPPEDVPQVWPSRELDPGDVLVAKRAPSIFESMLTWWL